MSENNANLSERSIKSSLSKALLNDIDSIFIEDSTESTNDNAKEHLKTQKNLFSVHLAEQQIAGSPSNPNFVHNHILRTEATGQTFGQAITFEDGKNLTEVNATLAPSILWNHDNCYALAVMWQQNGSDYEVLNFAK